MCGIAGLFGTGTPDLLAQQAEAMAGLLAHRGPDSKDVWVDPETAPEAGLALGFRRLAILDLSSMGMQPIFSPSGRYVMVFNGAIYNHQTLRSALGGTSWRGSSDSETLITAIEKWGLARTLPQLDGMFALAVWDRKTQSLSLARDRFGEKPLYYGLVAGRLLFASELKAFSVDRNWAPQINRHALEQFLRFGYVPAPHTILTGIAKLPAACLITLSAQQIQHRSALPAPEIWWEAQTEAAFSAASSAAIKKNPTLWLDGLDQRLIESVQNRLISDVPLGAFLSGGIDSSLIVALMRELGGKVRSFTVAFDDPRMDESPYACAVATHLGIEHCEIPVHAADALDLAPQLATFYDEPFSDVSQLPVLLLCRAVRDHVGVVLSGDGADELFGGYPRYADLARRWQELDSYSAWQRGFATRLAGMLPRAGLNRLGGIAQQMRLRRRANRPGDKLIRSLIECGFTSLESLACNQVAHWKAPDSPPITSAELWPYQTDLSEPGILDENWIAPASITNPMERLMFLDSQCYLPDDLLVKIDRASMAYGLEVRAPFLCPDLVRYAWQLPIDLKISTSQKNQFVGKWALRELLYRRVPRKLVDRPKKGFEPPLRHWLRGELRDWAEDLLSPNRLRDHGLLNPAPILERWREHVQGARDWHFPLWDVLVFQNWYNHWIEANKNTKPL